MLPFLIKFSFSECINIYTWALNILLLDCQKFLWGNVRCSRWQHNSMKCNVNGLVSWLSQFSLIREHYRCNKGKNEIVYVKVLVFILGRNVLYCTGTWNHFQILRLSPRQKSEKENWGNDIQFLPEELEIDKPSGNCKSPIFSSLVFSHAKIFNQ